MRAGKTIDGNDVFAVSHHVFFFCLDNKSDRDKNDPFSPLMYIYATIYDAFNVDGFQLNNSQRSWCV